MPDRSTQRPVHTEMQQLEPWFAEMHTQLFNTLQHAQAAVDEAQRLGQDLPEENDNYQQLKRDFEVAVAAIANQDAITAPLVKRTQALLAVKSELRLHLTQVWAAAVCTLTLHRMLGAIPTELADDEAVTGELKTKSAMHFSMWQHLLSDV